MFLIYFLVQQPEILECSNFNLKDIVTPVDVKNYADLLREVGYVKHKAKYLVDDFTNGFSLEYQGPTKVTKTSRNLILRVCDKFDLWNKVMKEVKEDRYVGPFEEIPFKHYIQSPIGLVPKDKGKKTRLIFHLSYPKSGDSVNSGIPDEFCTVKYPDFLKAVKICLKPGQGCHIAKSDMSMAFRNVPMNRNSWEISGTQMCSPSDRKDMVFCGQMFAIWSIN